MSGFEALLNKVKEAKLITEEEASAMLTDYNAAEQDRIDQAVAAAEGSAFKDGYNQGFTNAKQQADAEAKKALDDLLAKCDEEATAKLQTVIDALKESIDRDHTEKLEKIIQIVKDNYVPAEELRKMDEDHANKLAEVLEAKDDYDAKKLVIACESIKNAAKNKIIATEEFLNKKMQAKSNLLEKEINILKEEKETKLNTVTEAVEKYLNYALQTAIPTKSLISEAKFNASQKAIEKIISILKINSVIQESKDGIFQDYENQIKAAKDETNKVMLENVELKNKLNKNEAMLLLESKIKNCTPAEAQYLRKYFSHATSSKIIEEQIEDARNEFRKLNEERRLNLQKKIENLKTSPVNGNVVSESKTNDKESSAKTVVPAQKPVAEEPKSKSVYDTYADYLKNNKI